MSFLTRVEAKDNICAFFKAGWETGSIEVADEVPEIFWDDVDAENTPKDKPYVKFFIQHGGKSQVTLAKKGDRRYESNGVIIVEIYEPIQRRQGATLMDLLAEVALNIFEGESTSSEIWFRNTRIIEQATNAKKIDVYTEFEYDSLK